MARVLMHRRLDEALGQSLITLLCGLPRVGRTALIRQWAGGRPDTILSSMGGATQKIASVIVFDHFAMRDVDAFVELFRTGDRRDSRTRFVIVPTDLLTAERLRDALAGSVRTLDLDPLQFDDILAETELMSIAIGPTTAMAGPSATNLSPLGLERSWLRGGFPNSLEAESDEASMAWRRTMLDAVLARDYSEWGVPRTTRFPAILRWVANHNGAEFDDTSCTFASKGDLQAALYVLEKLGLTRRIPNFPAGSDASLAKKPRLYVRDTGVLHAMLGIETIGQLRDHPKLGDSWESYATEALVLAAGGRANGQFFRQRGGGGEDEVDLVLDFRPRIPDVLAIEFKHSPTKGPTGGFFEACTVIAATDRFVVHAGLTTITEHSVDRLDLASAIRRVSQAAVRSTVEARAS
jgi:hypothetical protein